MGSKAVILGTAQWGLPYGITNLRGRLADTEVQSLTGEARRWGIGVLDTSPQYGDAELRIGELAGDFNIQTKVLAHARDADAIRSSLRASLLKTRHLSFASVLVHDWASLSPSEQRLVAKVLEEEREGGLIEAVGVSAYEEEELWAALAAFNVLDVAQVPVSILDQRLDHSEVVRELTARSVRIQARSVFLQGLLLQQSQDGRFAAHPDLLRLTELVQGVSRMGLSVGYVQSRPWVDELVVGATSAGELDEILDALNSEVPAVPWDKFSSSDLALVDPRRWPQT